MIKIGDRVIGGFRKPYIVAEIGASHNGSINTCLALINTAKECGADAVKFQAFTPDSITLKSYNTDFIIYGGPWDGYRLYDLYEKAQTPRKWFPEMFALAKELDIPLFPSVFSPEDIDHVMQFNPPALKISSFELVDDELIHAACYASKNLIISTGMGSHGEIEHARSICIDDWGFEPVLLRCVSSYPAKVVDFNFNSIRHGDGISDHTMGSLAAVLAVTRGASMIEKHITLSRAQGGLDDGFASEPNEFRKMVDDVHCAYQSLRHDSSCVEDNPHKNLRRSLYVVEDIKAGEMFTPQNVRSIRPGYGLPVSAYHAIVNKCTAHCDIERGTALKWELVNVV